MWIFLKDAFLSIVEPSGRGKYDPDKFIMVRARIKGDIEKVFPGFKVVVDNGTDYKYRAFVLRSDVAHVMSAQVMGINYPNFKDSVGNSRRHDAYMRVWSVMADEQERPTRNKRRVSGVGYFNKGLFR